MIIDIRIAQIDLKEGILSVALVSNVVEGHREYVRAGQSHEGQGIDPIRIKEVVDANSKDNGNHVLSIIVFNEFDSLFEPVHFDARVIVQNVE